MYFSNLEPREQSDLKLKHIVEKLPGTFKFGFFFYLNKLYETNPLEQKHIVFKIEV